MFLKRGADLYWNLGLVILSIMMIGLITDFQLFGSADSQLHDTYFVISPLQAIFRLSCILISLRYGCLLVDHIMLKNKILALLASIIFAIILIILISITGMTLTERPFQLSMDFLLSVLAKFALIIYFGILEYKSLRQTFKLLEQ